MRVEVPTALLVLGEIGVLGAGVASRFVLRQPFVWSDELASILFLWLAMLGAVIDLQRTQHMRLTAVVSARQSCCSGRCCSRSPARCTSTTCITPWWRSSGWGSGCSRRLWA